MESRLNAKAQIGLMARVCFSGTKCEHVEVHVHVHVHVIV